MIAASAFLAFFQCQPKPPRPILEGPYRHASVAIAPDDTSMFITSDADELVSVWRASSGVAPGRIALELPNLSPVTDDLIALDGRVLVLRDAGESWTCEDSVCSMLDGPLGLRAVGQLSNGDAIASAADGVYRLGAGELTWQPEGLPTSVVSAQAQDGTVLVSDGLEIHRISAEGAEPALTPCLFPARCDAAVITVLATGRDGTIWAEAAGAGHLWTVAPNGTPTHDLLVEVPDADLPTALDDITAMTATSAGLWIAGTVGADHVLIRPGERASVHEQSVMEWSIYASPSSDGLLAVAQDPFAADMRAVWFEGEPPEDE
jgi:hypothetical protein